MPLDWQPITGDFDRFGAELVFLGPGPDEIAPTLVVSREQVPAGTDLAAWNRASVEKLRTLLHSYHLLDELPDQVGGQPAVARLGVYALDGRSLSLLQWATLNQEVGTTIAATCPTRRYAELVEELSVIAHSFSAEAT